MIILNMVLSIILGMIFIYKFKDLRFSNYDFYLEDI